MMKSKGEGAPGFTKIYCQVAYGKIPKFEIFVVVIATAKIYNSPFYNRILTVKNIGYHEKFNNNVASDFADDVQ